MAGEDFILRVGADFSGFTSELSRVAATAQAQAEMPSLKDPVPQVGFRNVNAPSALVSKDGGAVSASLLAQEQAILGSAQHIAKLVNQVKLGETTPMALQDAYKSRYTVNKLLAPEGAIGRERERIIGEVSRGGALPDSEIKNFRQKFNKQARSILGTDGSFLKDILHTSGGGLRDSSGLLQYTPRKINDLLNNFYSSVEKAGVVVSDNRPRAEKFVTPEGEFRTYRAEYNDRLAQQAADDAQAKELRREQAAAIRRRNAALKKLAEYEERALARVQSGEWSVGKANRKLEEKGSERRIYSPTDKGRSSFRLTDPAGPEDVRAGSVGRVGEAQFSSAISEDIARTDELFNALTASLVRTLQYESIIQAEVQLHAAYREEITAALAMLAKAQLARANAVQGQLVNDPAYADQKVLQKRLVNEQGAVLLGRSDFRDEVRESARLSAQTGRIGQFGKTDEMADLATDQSALRGYSAMMAERTGLQATINAQIEQQIARNQEVTEAIVAEKRARLFRANVIAESVMADPAYIEGLIQSQRLRAPLGDVGSSRVAAESEMAKLREKYQVQGGAASSSITAQMEALERDLLAQTSRDLASESEKVSFNEEIARLRARMFALSERITATLSLEAAALDDSVEAAKARGARSVIAGAARDEGKQAELERTSYSHQQARRRLDSGAYADISLFDSSGKYAASSLGVGGLEQEVKILKLMAQAQATQKESVNLSDAERKALNTEYDRVQELLHQAQVALRKSMGLRDTDVVEPTLAGYLGPLNTGADLSRRVIKDEALDRFASRNFLPNDIGSMNVAQLERELAIQAQMNILLEGEAAILQEHLASKGIILTQDQKALLLAEARQAVESGNAQAVARRKAFDTVAAQGVSASPVPTQRAVANRNMYDNLRHSGGAGGFFAGGAMSTIRYGLPSMALFGAMSGIRSTIREAEELQYNMAILEDQFNAVFSGQDFSHVKSEIMDVARATGLQADQVAQLRVQLTGAFADQNISGFSGNDLVSRQAEAAAKLAQTVKLPLAEVNDGLSATSLNFGVLVERIGDVGVALEQNSGVLAKEMVSFVGDVSPVFAEAGYSLEETMAMAAVSAQRSGRSGTALAEAWGRVIPSLTEASDKLFELAAADSSLGTPEFIDAIRGSNVKGILDGIGRAYAGMTKENKQAVIQLLGGRREAQVIIPALTNQDLIDDYVEKAKDSAGALDERFEKIKNTLTNALQRLNEMVKALGVGLMDAGLEDTLHAAIALGGLFVKALTPIINLGVSINETFGRLPAIILASVAAWKAMRALMQVNGSNAFALGLNRMMYGKALDGAGEVIAAQNLSRVSMGSALARRSAVGEGIVVASSRGGFANGRIARGLGVYRSIEPGTGSFRLKSAIGAAGEGSMFARIGSGLGATTAFGATAAGLAVTGGIVALGLVAKKVYDARKANAEKLEDLRAEIERANADVPEGNATAMEIRIEDLELQSQQARKDYNALQDFWNFVTNKTDEAAVLAASASALRWRTKADPNVKAMLEVLDTNKGAAQQYMEETYGQFESIYNDAQQIVGGHWMSEYINKVEKFDGRIKITRASKGQSDVSSTLSKEQTKVLDDLAASIGLKSGADLGGELVAAIINRDAGWLNDLRNSKLRNPNSGDDKSVEQALLLADAELKNLDPNSKLAKLMKASEDAANKLTPSEANTNKLDTLKAQLDGGLITAQEYVEKSRKLLESRRKMLYTGEIEATAQQRIDTAKLISDQAKTIADVIKSEQDTQANIAKALGESEGETNFRSYLTNLANLRNPDFTDPAARMDAALALIEAKKRTDLSLAAQSGDIDAVNKLLKEGSEVPAEAKSVLYTHQISGTRPYKDVVSLFSSLLSSRPRAGVGELLKTGNLDASKKSNLVPLVQGLGNSGEEIVGSMLNDYFAFGKISDEMSGKINKAMTLMYKRQAEVLSKADRDAITSSVDSFIDFLLFAGETEDQVKDRLAQQMAGTNFAGLTGDYGKAVQDHIAGVIGDAKASGTAFPDAEKQQAKFSYDQGKSLRDAQLEYAKALADRNESLMAQLELDAANAELAELKAAGPGVASAEQVIAAATRVTKANQAMFNVAKSVTDAKRTYLKTVLSNAGDVVGAAMVDIKQAEADLADAQRAGDEAGVAAALGAIDTANKAGERALRDVRDSRYGLWKSQTNDPVKAAQYEKDLAAQQLTEARGEIAKNEAQVRAIEAQKALDDAMQAARMSVFDLRQAELNAMGDTVGAAAVAAQAARAQLREAVAQGAGAASINSLRAQTIAADKAAKDAIFDEKMYDYKWMLDMGNITKSQYADYLEGLKSTLIPGTRQFKDLELTIKQLRDDIGSDLQHNLPTSLALPTLYETRRLVGAGASDASVAMGGGIGYQDNRNQNITVYVNNGMGQAEVISVLTDALDGSRSGSGPRRF